MLEQFRSLLRSKALLHTISQQAIIDNRLRNFKSALERMSTAQRQWAFGDHSVTKLEDLNGLLEKTPDDVAVMQQQLPPYGHFYHGEILVQNSGSTTSKKSFPFDIESWLHYVTPAARGLMALGVDSTDRILSTDPGSTQAGYRTPEDAAVWVCGAQLILDRSVSLSNKIKAINDHGVTVFIANYNKLERMAALKPKFDQPLKAVINTGMPLKNPKYIADTFGVEWVMDYYGSSEMGNTYYTCQHGHRHVHDDFVHAVQRDGKTLFSNLSSLPLWNYDLGDRIEYSYKGLCKCGSYLPTVDLFKTKDYTQINKG